MAKSYVWAIGEDGTPEKCYAKPENRGTRNCKHQFHSEVGQSLNEFMTEHSMSIQELKNEMDSDTHYGPTQEEIEDWAARIDEIAGCKLTEENYEEVMSSLTPAQIDEITKIGFEAAPAFSLPIVESDVERVKEETQIAFADLPDYGLSKASAMNEMFNVIGEVATNDGSSDIDTNYFQGLTEDQLFDKTFTTRGSQFQKHYGVSKPGEVARQLFYGLSETEVIDDCGGSHAKGISGCKAPGVCAKCAKKSGLEVKEGQNIAAIVSTNMTEGLTQASLNSVHSGGRNEAKAEWQQICSILKGETPGTAGEDAISRAREAKTTKEAREIIKSELTALYDSAGIKIDPYNIEVVAKQMTSYKNDSGQIRLANDDEKCDIFSMRTLGGHNNLFLQAELSDSYNAFMKPNKFRNNQSNAVVRLLR